jgi:tetratricopeptide (TPR) repeat protein
MLLLVGVSFGCTLLGSVLLNLPGLAGIGNPLAPGETVAGRLAWLLALIVLIHAWPFSLAVLTRWLQWPQLLRPAGVAILLLGAKPLAGLLGALAAGVLHGRWVGSTLLFLMLLDPINLAILLFALFLCRAAWRAYGRYRALVPAADRIVPPSRRRIERVAATISLVVGLALCGYLTWGQYDYATHFSLRGNQAEKERQALTHFNQGVASLGRNPTTAEQAFRRALPLWQELTTADPTRPEYHHNLAATWQNLGATLAQQGKLPEAEWAFRGALASYDRLAADFPAYTAHGNDRAKVQQVLTQFQAARALGEDAAETQEAPRLVQAGQHQAAAAAYRRALARHEQRRESFTDQAGYRLLLAVKQNRLAWLLANCPDPGVRDPRQAVVLASKAVENAPRETAFWNTLGAAHFRAGNWRECEKALLRAMQLGQGDALDWLFLAMAYHRLGKVEEARSWLARSQEWIAQMEQGKGADPLRKARWEAHRQVAIALRQEAEGLIRPGPGKGE